jgi:hypothetical protein
VGGVEFKFTLLDRYKNEILGYTYIMMVIGSSFRVEGVRRRRLDHPEIYLAIFSGIKKAKFLFPGRSVLHPNIRSFTFYFTPFNYKSFRNTLLKSKR